MNTKMKSETIGEFLDWLWDEKKVRLCQYNEDHLDDAYAPIPDSLGNLLAEFFRTEAFPCDLCGMTYNDCTNRIITTHQSCCGKCYETDTHGASD